jgi:hypothetical protein
MQGKKHFCILDGITNGIWKMLREISECVGNEFLNIE